MLILREDGSKLPAENGFPARPIIPGFYGTNSVNGALASHPPNTVRYMDSGQRCWVKRAVPLIIAHRDTKTEARYLYVAEEMIAGCGRQVSLSGGWNKLYCGCDCDQCH